MHTIDKKIIEDRIAFFEELKATLVVNNQSKWNAILNELQSILSNIKELEVVPIAFAPDCVEEWIDENNYLIVKNTNK
ncbi:MAG: hypothetical protein WCJ33_02165 [Pseudomonadota bacterium]